MGCKPTDLKSQLNALKEQNVRKKEELNEKIAGLEYELKRKDDRIDSPRRF